MSPTKMSPTKKKPTKKRPSKLSLKASSNKTEKIKEVKLSQRTVNNISNPQLPCEDARKVHPALVQYLGYGLHKITLRYKAMVNEYLENLQIQGPHFPILHVIKESQKPNQAQIGEELGVDKATMVKMIDHLEELGLIERVSSNEDRRSKILQLTKKGSVFLERAIQIRAEVEQKFLKILTKSESEQLRALIKKLLVSGDF